MFKEPSPKSTSEKDLSKNKNKFLLNCELLIQQTTVFFRRYVHRSGKVVTIEVVEDRFATKYFLDQFL